MEITMQTTLENFNETIYAWLEKCQELINAYYTKNYNNLSAPKLFLKKGVRYVKVVANNGSQKSVWAFVDSKSGDILKPASWNAPAKHSRGNIYDEHGGMSFINPYGVNYLR